MQDIKTAILRCELRKYITQKQTEQGAYELRYNHNHDPKTGRFISGKSGLTNSHQSGKIGAKNVTGKTATIDKRKFTEYALDPVNHPDKARAFKEALGFDKSNYQLLEKQIREKFDRNNLVYKMTNEQGDLYSLLLTIAGVNGKTAKVMTGWIDDKNDKRDFHLTSVYVDK